MLTELRIHDLAIIDALQVRFEAGFNVLSGETGAGKSIVLQGLGLALGQRASAELVRGGAGQARVEATFEPGPAARAFLADRELAPDEGEPLVLRRVVQASGRSRSYVNDTPVAAATLRELASALVDVAGQHEFALLLDPARHVGLLDRFGGCAALADEVAGAVQGLRGAEDELGRLREREADRVDRLDLLRFQRDELEAADPQPDEESELERELEVLRRAGELRAVLAGAEEALYSAEGSAVELAGRAQAALQPFAELDDEVGGALRQVDEALYALEDAARSLASSASRIQEDPERVEELEERREILRALQRKHRTDLTGLLRRRAEIEAEIDELAHSEERMERLVDEVRQRREAATERARALSRRRREAARELRTRVETSLAELAMTGARFAARVEEAPGGLGEAGLDAVAFELAANPGEELRPLARVASGGELSRILLALKECLRDASPVETLVLDEVDAGIGGATADVVGHKLAALSDGAQLIVITHLPQIAARATAHYRVDKRTADGRTSARVERLDEPRRLDELARMVSGDRHAERSRALAEEMLAPPTRNGEAAS